MSDEQHDHHQPGGFPLGDGFGFIGDPEDLRKFIEDRQAHVEIEMNASAHERIRIVEEMPKEMIEYVKGLLDHVTAHDEMDAAVAAAYHAGFYKALLWVKFGVCPACGLNHHEELAEAE